MPFAPKELRIVYMGTPEFAVFPLKELVDNEYNIATVVTAPDKPAGRGQKISQSAVKEFAKGKGLDVLQPHSLKDIDFISQIKSIDPHLIIVVAFRMLPQEIWNIPKLGTFNLHASLLPQYRGAAPINWAVINGEAKTGLTTFLIDHKIDTGSILLQQEAIIHPDETAGELHDRLMELGSKLVLKTVNQLAAESIKPIPQNTLIHKEHELKLAPKLFKENMRINWAQDSQSIHNHIRGLSPYPVAWTELHTPSRPVIPVKVFRSRTAQTNGNVAIGAIATDTKGQLFVGCKSGLLEILELQLAGKKRVTAKEFLAGFRDIENSTFV